MISIEVPIGTFLRTLAGAQYLYTMITFGTAKTSVYARIHNVCSAVWCVLLQPTITKTEQAWKQIIVKFAYFHAVNSPSRGFCSAIDSIIIKKNS